jgi:hypothetical protein
MSDYYYRALKEAVERLEEIDIPEPKPPSVGLGGEMAKTGYKSPGGTSLPAHAASDEDKFAEINRRLNNLKDRVDRLYWQLGNEK